MGQKKVKGTVKESCFLFKVLVFYIQSVGVVCVHLAEVAV